MKNYNKYQMTFIRKPMDRRRKRKIRKNSKDQKVKTFRILQHH